jgi:apolipoprotein N-acyltransferase
MAVRARHSVGSACFFAPLVWVLIEYVQTQVPCFGFPCNLLGYPASQNPALLQLTALTGIWGLSFLVAAFNALVVWALLAPPSEKRLAWRMLGGAALALLVVTVIGPRLVPKAEAKHQARLVQMNFPESMNYPSDWMAVHAGDMDELERLSVGHGTRASDLIVWPEVPAPFSMGDPAFTARARRIAETAHSDFLFGVVDWHPATAGESSLPHNSAALLRAAPGEEVTYDKIHLVPFGEYVPLRRWLTFAEKLTADIGDFTPGHVPTVGQLANGGSEGTVICFEAIFPDLVRRFTDRGAELLINISNDGWVDGTAAPAQHLMMARVRAVENRRWLLRATNTGQTVSVDPYGRIAARLEPDVRGVLYAEYDFRTDKTLYTRAGDWFVWLCVLALLGMEISGARRKNRLTNPQTNPTTSTKERR